MVTGGAGGIGVATVEALAVAGAQVVLADVADDTAKAAAEKLAAQGLSVVGHGVDISAEASVERLVDSPSTPSAASTSWTTTRR